MFIHDPLYKWMLSPLQAIKRQRNADKVQNPHPNGDATAAASDGNGGGAAANASKPTGRGGDNHEVALLEAADGHSNYNEASGMREAAERTLTRIRQKLQGCVL